MSGIWPPSNPMRMELPDRAVWPLPPRPEVLPCPLDSPLPRRLRRCLEPGRGFRSCKRIKLSRKSSWSCGRLGSRCGRLDLQTAAAVNLFAQTKLLQAMQSGLYNISRIFGTERLAQNILDADRLQNRTNGLPGNNPSSGRGRAQQNVG